MRTIHIPLIFLSLFILTACGQTKVSGPFVDPDASWPEDCRNQGYFSEEFPLDVVYPKSVPINSMAVGNEGESGFLANFCTKSTAQNIVSWYKNQYESQGYEYYTIETVHFWKSPIKSVMLDVREEPGDYVHYSVDVRWKDS